MSRSDVRREAAKMWARRQAHRLGLEIGGYRGSFADRRDRLLQETGTTVVFDVGANVGQYADALRRGGFSGLVVSVEPNPDALELLQRRSANDPGWLAIGSAIGAVAGESILNVSANSVSSSLLNIDARHVAAYPQSAYVGEVRVPVMSLDKLVTDIARPEDMLFVKIDVQGYEHAVLSGASMTLRRATGIEIECSLTRLYAGQAHAWELLRNLNEQGFEAVDFERVCWNANSGDLMQINALLRRTQDFSQ